MTEAKLKPCPFCGGETEITQRGDNRQSNIYNCTECGCTLETGETWEVPSRWNARPIEDALLEALEGVREIIAEGAAVGFIHKYGYWAERLFLSQQKTSAAIKLAKGE